MARIEEFTAVTWRGCSFSRSFRPLTFHRFFCAATEHGQERPDLPLWGLRPEVSDGDSSGKRGRNTVSGGLRCRWMCETLSNYVTSI